MTTDASIGHGPVDYLLVEWTGKQPTGEALPHLIDLVDRGIVRILDLVLLAKDDAGELTVLEVAEVADEDEAFSVLVGVGSGLLGEEDFAQAGEVMETGTSAAFLVYENSWAAGFATALRNSGAELVASGRIPAAELLAAIDDIETTERD